MFTQYRIAFCVATKSYSVKQCCHVYQIILETPNFQPYLPVSRLKCEISRIITEVCHFFISVDSTFQRYKKFQLFCVVCAVKIELFLINPRVCHSNLVGNKPIRSNVTISTTSFSRVLCHRKFVVIGVNEYFLHK